MTRANEPAFPFPSVTNANGDCQYGANGMTLREYYAGLAMQGLLAGAARLINPEDDAADAVVAADALIARLAETEGKS